MATGAIGAYPRRHVRESPVNVAANHRASASGGAADRRRVLERRGRAQARHLDPDGEGSCGRTAAEARCVAAAPDPGGVSRAHRRRPARTEPRADLFRARGLTATAPARFGAQVQSSRRYARTDGRAYGRGHRTSERSAGGVISAAYHRTAATDVTPRQRGRAHYPPRRAGRLREDDARAGMDGPARADGA